MAACARAGAAIGAIAYAADPARVALDLDAYRALAAGAPLVGRAAPVPPDCDSAENLAAKLASPRDAGVDRVDFYHYGLAPLSALDRVREALALAGSDPQLRQRRRARPGVAPVCTPASSTSSPFTTTCSKPSARRRGSLVGGDVPHGLEVEDREVGRHARTDEPAIGEPQPLRESEVIWRTHSDRPSTPSSRT